MPVSRLIPVSKVVVPDNVVDLPNDGMKQFGERRDRINDVTQSQHDLQQQELKKMEANIEANSEDDADQAEMKDEERAQKKDKATKPKHNKRKKRKHAEDVHDMEIDSEVKEEERVAQMEEEADPPDVQEMKMYAKKPKTKPKQVVNQTYEKGELRPAYTTNKDARSARLQKKHEAARLAEESTRTKLTKARAKLAGDAPKEVQSAVLWLKLAPLRKTLLSNNLERVWKEDHERQRHVARPRQVAREEVVYDRVAPDTRRETQVRLGTHTMTAADVHEDEDWMVYGNEEEVYDDEQDQQKNLIISLACTMKQIQE